jgi:hypothetical protein
MLDTLGELTPLPAELPVTYASADDLLTVSDLPERNVTIKRWHRNGKPLTIRIRALDLDQQDRVNTEAMVKNKRTNEWEQSEPALCAATLREAVVTPRLTNEQAQAMRKHNPIIIRTLVNFIWSLSALDDDTIEQTARALNPQATPTADAGDDPSDP